MVYIEFGFHQFHQFINSLLRRLFNLPIRDQDELYIRY